jgi:tetratricopeptide (TPR) repeat protein
MLAKLKYTAFMNPFDRSMAISLCLLASCFAVAGASGSVSGQIATTQKSATTADAESLVAQGVRALEENNLAEAKRIFLKAVELNSRDATAHTYLGIVNDREGDLESAERHFAAAVQADPRSASAHNNHGVSLLKLGRTNEAAYEFQTSLSINKNQPNALTNLAQLRLNSGGPVALNEALSLFDQAYQLQPDAETARALVVVSLRLGKRESAAGYYRTYSASIEKPGVVKPSISNRIELGVALLENDLNADAVSELTAAVGTNPSNQDAILHLAKAHLKLNNIPEAGRVLEGAVARGVETAPIYALLATVYEKGNHIENAIPAMRLAIQADPKSETYRFMYGLLLINALAPEAAVIRLKEAMELFPNSSRLWLALGIAHFKAGRNDEAANSLKKSIELDSTYAPAFVYLGMTYVETGDYRSAITTYESGLRLNPKLTIVDFLIADVMMKQTDSDPGVIEAHLLKAVKADPKYAPARLTLGKLYLRKSKLTEAATEFEQVVALEPNVAEAYYQLGLTYRRLKRSDEAAAMLDKFKSLSESQKEQAAKDRKDIINRLATVLF